MTRMSQAAWKTRSGKAIRPQVVRGMAQQIERYDRALKLVDSATDMVESERPPPRDNGAAPTDKDQKKE